MPGWGILAILGGLLALSAFFSASESALFSLGRLRLREMEERHGILGARVRALLQDPQQLLLTILLGNTLVNVAFCSLSTAWILIRYGGGGLGEELGAGFGALGVLLTLGEAIPKAVPSATAPSPEKTPIRMETLDPHTNCDQTSLPRLSVPSRP